MSPWRRWLQNPEKILGPYIKEGMKILEIGPGMGFFTLPIARMVGADGKVIAVDVQTKMLRSLERRADKTGLRHRIEARLCPAASLNIGDLADTIDFAIAFAVMHEIPDPKAALNDIAVALKAGGILLISEPKNHVSDDEFKRTISLARECGLTETATPVVRRNYSVSMIKQKK